MNNEELKQLTLFISAWVWQIIALMMLGFSFVFLALPKSLTSSVFYVAFFLVFIICEYFALKRRGEFYNEN